MHSTSARAQNVFGFFTTVSFFVGLFTALSVFLYPSSPTASVDITNVKVVRGRPQYSPSAKPQEYAFINFSLDADLTSLFNWNTKQVFTYLSVSYPGARGTKHSDNEVVIWDKIIQSKDEAKLDIVNEKAKYQINDISGKWLGRNATVRLGWNVQPHVGALYWGVIERPDAVVAAEEGKRWGFEFPEVGAGKTKKTEKKTKAKAKA